MKNLIERLRSWWKSRTPLEQRPVPEEDPIIKSSLATPIAVSSLLLMLSLFWALYDEAFGLRPWIGYQQDFVEAYRQVLTDIRPDRAVEEEQLRSSAGYQELAAQIEEARTAIQEELTAIQEEERLLGLKLAALTRPFTTNRSRIQAVIYAVETSTGDARESLQDELEQLRKGPYSVAIPESIDEVPGEREFTFQEMEETFNEFKARQAQLQSRQVELLREPSRLRRKLNEYSGARLTGLTEAQVDGLLNSLDDFQIEIKQIHVAEMGLVDRCQSCHLGIGTPVVMTREDLGGNGLFISHPKSELLDIHDPETFGCSPCHNGNGVATVSAQQAHGQYKHWLWPLYSEDNFEAGCLQCHEADRHLEMASTLNSAKEFFYQRGCWGCHPREGFDIEPRLLREAHQAIGDLTRGRVEAETEIDRTIQQADQAETNEEANRLYSAAESITMGIADIDSQLQRLNARLPELMMEIKRVGPNLKEIPLKVRREWLPVWIQNPHEFRPNTKMPRFRLEEDEVQAIAAFIWQSGIENRLPRQPAGNPARGQTLFESRGCMACHSMGEGEDVSGGDFAANLSRVGEKANYDYLVRWVHNPRQRTLPYCSTHERDITPEDYAGQGLPFEFGLENNLCPLGDHLLQVQQPTVMPNLRLTRQEARDISTYLMTQKHEDAEYAPAPFLDDPQLFDRGRALVRHNGCTGCHEIGGLEGDGKIGTDLTKEGSKPIERLDFALLTREAKEQGWYNNKGFFEHKLEDSAVFDQGKIKEPLERLRMPDFALEPEEIKALTTLLLGSVESKIPESFYHRPAGPGSDIQDGWAIVKKYNCVACHQFTPGQQTVLDQLPRYQTPDGREQLPPSLVGQGARVNPEWLAGFLKNPALSQREMNRNGVRPYLQVRMPTFNLSDGEAQKLVRFFNALSKEPLPFAPPRLEPLSGRELTMARDLFTHRTAPCLRCHATGDPAADRDATAPNFQLIPERLKSNWTERWIVHPEIIRPGTAMPSGLFRRDGDRWVFALGDVRSLRGYQGDHAKLLVRYMFEFSPEEQRRLRGR